MTKSTAEEIPISEILEGAWLLLQPSNPDREFAYSAIYALEDTLLAKKGGYSTIHISKEVERTLKFLNQFCQLWDGHTWTYPRANQEWIDLLEEAIEEAKELGI